MDRLLSHADFEEIKEYYAFSRSCWADPRPRSLTGREHELVEKYQGVDLLLVMIEAFEKAELETFAAKDRAYTYEKDKLDLQLRLKVLQDQQERIRSAVKKHLLERDLNALRCVEIWSGAGE